MLALAFLHAGPRGMEVIAEASRGIEFPDAAERPATFPPGWAADIDAFRSGLDFSSIALSDDEKSLLYGWYLRTIGEVPATSASWPSIARR